MNTLSLWIKSNKETRFFQTLSSDGGYSVSFSVLGWTLIFFRIQFDIIDHLSNMSFMHQAADSFYH